MDIEKILHSMTLEDKIALCSGESFWETKANEKYGIPALFMCDGPHGLRKQERSDGADMLGVNQSSPATCFPAEVTMAGSWDPELLSKVGAAIGEEACDQSVGLVLGPGANLKRNPLCGRNFEYFSEDPYLAGKLAAGFIRGVESQGVGTSLKHFACNSQEKSRFVSDSVVDERTLRELYLPAFEIAVKEGRPSTVMCAYPKLNGVHCSDHKELLTHILREDWGFDGMVVTDWGAMNDRIEAFRAGCDLNMPGGSSYMEKEALEAVKSGTLPESAVDDSVRRILKLVFQSVSTLQTTELLKIAETPRTNETLQTTELRKTAEYQQTAECQQISETQQNAGPLKSFASCDYDAHHALAAKMAAAGAVLLKNEGNVLPLQESRKAALIGCMARRMRYQGAGSSHINPIKITSPADAMPNLPFASGCDERGDTTDALLAEAVKLAKSVEVPVVFAGLPDRYESEGFDREDMKMPEGHLKLIEAVAEVNPNTVVVLLSGCAVECPWEDKVKAILYMGLPGQAGGQAVADLLYGRVNPSGRLAESWPLRYEDCPSAAYYGKTKDALYMESIYVGYRYYDKAKKNLRWPFGYGLSYTTFGYSGLQVEGRTVSVTVTNTGAVAGAEVVQLYLCPPQNGLHRPVRELKGFQKVFLQPGKGQTVTFQLDDRAFALWQDGWKIPAGTYGVEVGGLAASVQVKGVTLPVPSWQSGSWYETCKGTPVQADWEAVLGRKYTPAILRKGHFTMDNTVMEMKDYSLIMKIMYKAVESTIARGFDGKKDYENPEFRMLMEASAGGPLRSMQISGGMKGGIFQGLLDMANGHFFRGIWKMIRG
ncbi:MAG: glycosyl hydrolase [Lachnospiraceae bacterium]|nr:glycosyl hydrolase [Lachnospiraceae bacterium]